MTLNLKIEILKVFSLEFNMTSDNKTKQKEKSGEESTSTKPAPAAKQ